VRPPPAPRLPTLDSSRPRHVYDLTDRARPYLRRFARGSDDFVVTPSMEDGFPHVVGAKQTRPESRHADHRSMLSGATIVSSTHRGLEPLAAHQIAVCR